MRKMLQRGKTKPEGLNERERKTVVLALHVRFLMRARDHYYHASLAFY